MFHSDGIGLAAVSSLAGAIGAIVGTFLSPWIAGRWGLKQRKAEIYLSQKADAYAALFKAVHDVIFSPQDAVIYSGYLTAFERAKMFASDDVRRMLEGETKSKAHTLSNAVQLLRQSESETQRGPESNSPH
jgi:hypothetical protein